jgi:hypothetical protein
VIRGWAIVPVDEARRRRVPRREDDGQPTAPTHRSSASRRIVQRPLRERGEIAEVEGDDAHVARGRHVEERRKIGFLERPPQDEPLRAVGSDP